jgi:hypothetical protein
LTLLEVLKERHEIKEAQGMKKRDFPKHIANKRATILLGKNTGKTEDLS